MSAFAARIQQLVLVVEEKLPKLLVPESDDKLAQRQELELCQIRDQLQLLVRDIRSHENLLRAQTKSKRADPWALKQRLADIRMDRERAEELARRIQIVLESKGLNPMKIGEDIHELLENLHLPSEQMHEALSHLRTHYTQPSIEAPATSQVDLFHAADVASQMVVLGYILVSWAIKKRSDARKKQK